MALTGYLYESREDIAPYVDTIPGRATDRLQTLARQYDAYIVFGLPERDPKTDIYYNSAALVGPDGVVGKYRKVHQWEAEEHWAAWGDLGMPVYDTPLGRIAINICMDSGYFESSRVPAVEGADIIAFPTNSSIQAIYYNQARALQNGVYVIGANRNDTEKNFHMVGMSGIWGPDGDKLAEAPYVGKEDAAPESTEIIYATIDPERYATREERLAGRRPELYQPLMLHIAPWNYSVDSTERDLTVGTLQYTPQIGDKAANLNKVIDLLRSNTDSDLIVLPEYSLTGEDAGMDSTQADIWAEPLDGETFKQMSLLAQEAGSYLLYTQIERDTDDKLYVTAVVVDAKGEMQGFYRKTHLNDAEKRWATAGDNLNTIDLPDFGRLGILLGEDVLYPEAAGVLSGQRADVIAIPSSWAGEYGTYVQVNQQAVANPYPERSMVLWDAVAYSAQAYTVVANFVGGDQDYRGESALYTLDPLYGLDQAQVASSSTEENFSVSFKTKQNAWWLNQFNMISSRRTDYYQPLIMKQAN